MVDMKEVIRLTEVFSYKITSDFTSKSGKWLQPDDLHQEAYLLVLEKINDYDPSRGSLSTFIYLLVYKAISREVMKQFKAIGGLNPKVFSIEGKREGCRRMDIVDGHDPIAEVESNIYVEELLQTLPPDEEKVIRSLYVDRNGFNRTCRILKKTPKWVSETRNLAIRRLRGDEDGEEYVLSGEMPDDD
jgi:RNA polymerase sigma factor (sigma-70 family)